MSTRHNKFVYTRYLPAVSMQVIEHTPVTTLSLMCIILCTHHLRTVVKFVWTLTAYQKWYFVISSTPEPNPPDQVTITQTTCNSVTFNWTRPTHNGNAEITGYKVLVYNDSNDILVHTNTTMMSYEVTSLKPKTDYTVEIRAENVGGFGNGTSTNFTTKETGDP